MQIDRAIDFHESTFGKRPSGMWPSEGSLSDEAVTLIGEAGFQWIATDEDLLSRSLGQPMSAELLYRPYRLGGGPVAVFRDHGLSDRIGFHYQTWDATAAAHDFVERVRDAGRRYSSATGGEVATVSVILDGENAWEHYPGGGRPFLRALYGALEGAADIQTVTMAEAGAGAAAALPSIFPGSWINGDFYIWIGHRDDHRAWDQLSAARQTYDDRAPHVGPRARSRALDEILIAEGSDWFWWYGDDHSSDHDAEFDELFRRHLRNAYAALDVSPPEDLFATNISTSVGPDRLEPSGLLEVTLDGRDTSFLEWVGSVSPILTKVGGAMHEVAATTAFITGLRIGLSRSALCFRLTAPGLGDHIQDGSVSLALVLAEPDVRIVPIERQWTSVGETVEVAVPLDRVNGAAEIAFAIQARDETGEVLETVPQSRFWTIARAVAPAI